MKVPKRNGEPSAAWCRKNGIGVDDRIEVNYFGTGDAARWGVFVVTAIGEGSILMRSEKGRFEVQCSVAAKLRRIAP